MSHKQTYVHLCDIVDYLLSCVRHMMIAIYILCWKRVSKNEKSELNGARRKLHPNG